MKNKMIYLFCTTRIKGRYAPFLQFIISKYGDPHERRGNFLNCLPFFLFPTLSSLFLPCLVLSCFPILSSPLEDGRTGGCTDVRTYGRIDGQTELNFIGCLQKGRTHTRTSYSIIILDRVVTMIS